MTDTTRTSLLIYVLTLVAVLAVLSALGFYYFERPANDDLTLWDSLWWAFVTVTTVGYGDLFPKSVGGRLVAVLLMLGGIGILGVFTAAIAAYFVKNDQLQQLKLRTLREHAVICGLGDEGLLLTKAFREQGMEVVVVERKETDELLPTCAELGAIIIIGDATEPEVLQHARVPTAKFLVAVCGDDGANAEIAAHARRQVEGRSNALTCSTHIVNPDLWHLLRKWEMAMPDSFRLQFFNIFDIGARALLNEHPPFASMDGADGTDFPDTPPHLLIVGGGRLGQSLVVHAARAWRDHPEVARGRLRVTFIDRDTHQITEFLHLRHPELTNFCAIRALSLDITGPDFHRGEFLFDEDGRCDVTRIYVCIDNDALALGAALALLNRTRGRRVPIVVRMTQEAGLAALLSETEGGGRGFETLHAVGLLEHTCQPALVLGGTIEMLARTIHTKYLEDQRKLGATPGSNPLLVSWEHLPEEARESNRRQADHIGIKLLAINCDIAPLAEWDAHLFTFEAEEVELMSRMEHERWLEERRQAGWTYAPQRDMKKKTNPSLVPWDQLTDETREYNRKAVCELPLFLSRAGFQIYRMESEEVL